MSLASWWDDGEVRHLVEEWQRTGDAAIAEAIVQAHYDLLDHMVRRYAQKRHVRAPWTGPCREALAAAGAQGLKKAMETFDLEKPYTFATYAAWCIRQELIRLVGQYAADRPRFVPLELAPMSLN